jgi:hypothetical protein
MTGGKCDKGRPNKKARGEKRKRPPNPPSEDFGDSEFLEERLSSEGEESPLTVPLSSSSAGSNDFGALHYLRNDFGSFSTITRCFV